LARYRKEGAAGLVHGNRGRRPHNKLDDTLRERLTELATSKYAGLNNQHLSEVLVEREGLKPSRSTVRRVLLGSGIKSPRKRRAPRHRSRRERYPQQGMLLQMDASHHDWLEGRGPRLCLVGAVDDATGEVPHVCCQSAKRDTLASVHFRRADQLHQAAVMVFAAFNCL
jgi:hypothetical protein